MEQRRYGGEGRDVLTHSHTTALLVWPGMLLVVAVLVIAAVTIRRTRGAAA